MYLQMYFLKNATVRRRGWYIFFGRTGTELGRDEMTNLRDDRFGIHISSPQIITSNVYPHYNFKFSTRVLTQNQGGVQICICVLIHINVLLYICTFMYEYISLTEVSELKPSGDATPCKVTPVILHGLYTTL